MSGLNGKKGEGYLQHIERCNRYDLSGFRQFAVGGQPVGWVRHSAARRLADWPIFEVSADSVTLAGDVDSFAPRTDALHEVVAALAATGEIQPLRNEAFPVRTSSAAAPLFQLDRSAVPFFGVVAYGVHLNGIVGDGDEAALWIGRRSKRVTIEPGKLDNLVAGGQPVGIGFKENLIKEAEEEAGLPSELAAQARPVSVVSYTREIETGLKPDVLFIYDLVLPPSFEPCNRDGEIDAFELWPVARVLDTVRKGFDFKFNVSLVLIDFGIRHGFIGPEEPDYLALCHGLRRPAL